MPPGGQRPGPLLVLHPGALGDLVQALPALAALRARWAPAPVGLLVGASHAGFARGTGLFDQVLAFDDAGAYHGGVGRRVRVLAAAARAARGFRPAACAVFKASPVYGALALASGARVRAGLTRGGAGARLLTHAVRVQDHAHWEDRYAAVARLLGADPAAHSAGDVGWPAADGPELDLRGPAVGVAPGGARNAKADLPQKRWPAERFAEVARALVRGRPGARVVLLGAPSDRAEADAVAAALRGAAPVVDLVGRTSVAGARAAIAHLDVFLTNDSALLHVAATTRTPTVAVFGPTDPRAICPRAPTVTPVWRPAGAAPCYDDVTGRVRPCGAECCMARVAAGDVYAAAAPALDAASPAA